MLRFLYRSHIMNDRPTILGGNLRSIVPHQVLSIRDDVIDSSIWPSSDFIRHQRRWPWKRGHDVAVPFSTGTVTYDAVSIENSLSPLEHCRGRLQRILQKLAC